MLFWSIIVVHIEVFNFLLEGLLSAATSTGERNTLLSLTKKWSVATWLAEPD
jgi:hypothetical protein